MQDRVSTAHNGLPVVAASLSVQTNGSSTSTSAGFSSKREDQWPARIRNGDKDAFKELFRAYYIRLCTFAEGFVGSSDVACDVVQEVFIKIWTGRGQWTLRGSLKAYLYQAVRNQALSHLERERRRTSREHVSAAAAVGEERTAEDDYRLEELAVAIWKAIDRLPERRRTAFVLHRQHEFTYKEVAQIMGSRPKTVEHQVGRALKFLREVLPSEYF